MNKRVSIFLIIALIAVAGLFLWLGQAKAPVLEEKGYAENGNKKVESLVRVQIERDPVLHEVPYEKGMTALQATQKATVISVKGEGENAFITDINDRQAREADREFWELSVNHEVSQVGAGSFVLQPGDLISWRIETY